MIQNYSEQDQAAIQDDLQAARQQIGRAATDRRSIATASVTPSQSIAEVTPLEQTVAYALLGQDPPARAAAQQALRDVVGTLNTVAERKQKVDVMMAQLLRDIRAMRARARQRTAWKVAMAILFLVLFFLSRSHVLNFWWLFVTGGGAVAADEQAGKRRKAAHALYAAGEPRAVGVLAIAARDGDYSVQRVADQALRDLLPRVRASDAAYIDAEQMTALLRLAEEEDAHMQGNVLKALEQIGDHRAIPVVKQLAEFGRTTSVRKQAQECLLFLTERVRLAHEQATLLRGAASPTVAEAPMQLLRPASGAPETPVEQLLRPTQ